MGKGKNHDKTKNLLFSRNPPHNILSDIYSNTVVDSLSGIIWHFYLWHSMWHLALTSEIPQGSLRSGSRSWGWGSEKRREDEEKRLRNLHLTSREQTWKNQRATLKTMKTHDLQIFFEDRCFCCELCEAEKWHLSCSGPSIAVEGGTQWPCVRSWRLLKFRSHEGGNINQKTWWVLGSMVMYVYHCKTYIWLYMYIHICDIYHTLDKRWCTCVYKHKILTMWKFMCFSIGK